MPKQSTGPGRTTSARRTGGTRPLGPRAQRVPSQAKSPARLKLERLSIRPLHFVRRLPKLVVPIAMGALLLAGLLITAAWSGLLLLALAAFLGWLLALSWPALVPSSRWIRLLVVVAIVAAAVWRLTGSA
jgi:hypothetical protein